MNKANYIPAFTIIEAVVSMAITAIILSIIFVIFSIASERLMDFKKQNEQISDMNRMTYSINKSIFESEKMKFDENMLLFDGYDGNTTKYTLTENYFIRISNTLTDTFKLKVQKVKIDTVSSKSEREVYQRLQWKVKVNDRSHDFSFYKKIYAADLLKLIEKP